MLKHERGKIMAFILLAIVGFFALIAMGTAAIHVHQQVFLKQSALVVGSNQQSTSKSDLHFVDLSGDSLRARDLRTHTVGGQTPAAGNFDVIHPHGRAEIVYYYRSGGKLYALTQRKQTLVNSAPYLSVLFALLYWGAFVILMLIRRRKVRELNAEIAALARQTQQIADNQPVDSLLLTKNSRLYPLATGLEQLQGKVSKTRQQARLRHERFTMLLANLPQGIMQIDDKRQVRLSNRAMGEILDQSISPAVHPVVDDIKDYKLAHMLDRCLKTGQNQRSEITLSMSDRTVDASVLSVGTAKQRQALIILYDLSYFRAVEQMQTDFVANVSHELKTPVTAIEGFAETLLDGAKDDPAVRDEFLNIIASESKRLTRLVNDILTLQSPERKPTPQLIHLRAFTDEIVRNLNKQIAARNLDVDVQIDDAIELSTDQSELTQVMRNLIDNAVFYNRENGKVRVSAYPDAQNVVIRVTDTGIGIPQADQERIFERFYRVDKARSRNNGGTGLGLAIVHSAVAELGGTIKLQSRPGVGSTFTVTLPRNEESASQSV
ncbi:MAG: ATP-binding protein [Lacticaseibacillus songhuajiangensis]|jgi:two-component system phosphate regulon sensor histidine kinase PhoR|nr:ATP-binding protein [Lacticaseibacillus songhuajiangensis]